MIKILKPLLVLTVIAIFFSCNLQQENSEKPQKVIIDTTINTDVAPAHDSLCEVIDDAIKTEQGEKIKSLTELYKCTQKKPSTFVIRANRDTVIKCNEGTLLSIPANCFVRAKDGKAVDGNIKLSVKEYYKISDMLLANLTTSSNGNMIETGGMMNIKAFDELNDSLIISKEKSVSIAMPTKKGVNNKGMQLFNGVHDAMSGINWQTKNDKNSLAQQWNLSKRYDLSAKNVGNIKFNGGDYNIETKIPLSYILNNPIREFFCYGYIDTLGCLNSLGAKIKLPDYKFNISATQYFLEGRKVHLQVYYTFYYEIRGGDEYLKQVCAENKYKQIDKISIPIVLRFKEYKLQPDKYILIDDYNFVSSLANYNVKDLASASDYLVLSTQKLNWINCDRFPFLMDKTDYLVKLKEKTNLLIVFNRIKSMMSSDSEGKFKNIPLGEKITIVALKTENEKLMLAMQETTVTKEPFENLDFKPVTVAEYKAKLQQLNSL